MAKWDEKPKTFAPFRPFYRELNTNYTLNPLSFVMNSPFCGCHLELTYPLGTLRSAFPNIMKNSSTTNSGFGIQLV